MRVANVSPPKGNAHIHGTNICRGRKDARSSRPRIDQLHFLLEREKKLLTPRPIYRFSLHVHGTARYMTEHAREPSKDPSCAATFACASPMSFACVATSKQSRHVRLRCAARSHNGAGRRRGKWLPPG